jgi:putative ubiquitin-RnfH superfamily antitoxin RatB of RatAB toxin-antitoxin module
MGDSNSIAVMVCYATANQQVIIPLELPPQTNILQAIQQSGVLDQYTEIDLAKNTIGVFGKLVNLDQVLQDKDRIEIYRPLRINPMDARRSRAAREQC